MWRRTTRYLVAVVVAVALGGLFTIPIAVADHGEGHNGETMELSKSEGIADGEVVTVTLTSWLPGNTATIVTCFRYPAAGPADCELSNYGQHTAQIGDDGTATYDYPVAVVPGRCDETTPCYIVAGDGFGPDANYASQLVTFAGSSSEPEPVAEPTEEMVEPVAEPTEEMVEPVAEPTEEMVEPVAEPTEEMVEPVAEPTEEMVEPVAEPTEEMVEPVAEPTEEMVEPASEPTEEMAAPADSDDGGTSVWVWLIPVIVVVVIVVFLALLMNRRRAAGSTK